MVWVGTTPDRLRRFPAGARREAGYQLRRVQLGEEPSDWKPMRSVGAGVVELRMHAEGENRVLVVTRFAEAIYVLHAFEKKTQQTRQTDLELGRRNLAAVLQHRRGRS